MRRGSARKRPHAEAHESAGLPHAECRPRPQIEESYDAAMVRMNPSVPSGNNGVPIDAE
jgi:hypothetical protein